MKRPVVVVAALVLVACARHGDMPPALDVAEPPVPSNFSVATTDHVTFELSWEIDDPTAVVAYYRLYGATRFTSLALLDTTSATSVVVVAADSVPIHGVTFCVSSVTTQCVESRLVCKTPD